MAFFGFNYMFNEGVMPLYKKGKGRYSVNNTKTKIPCNDGSDTRQFFSNNNGSIKRKLVKELNDGTLSEEEAWEKYAIYVRNRAHSYRVDLESFTLEIDMVDQNVELTHLGYRYVQSCKDNDPFKDLPKMIYQSEYPNNGNMNVLLQFVYQVSEEYFEKDKLMWSTPVLDKKGNVIDYKFNSTKYREDIEDIEDKFLK